MDVLFEIEKINERMAFSIDMNAERTREIITLEEMARRRMSSIDMPE